MYLVIREWMRRRRPRVIDARPRSRVSDYNPIIKNAQRFKVRGTMVMGVLPTIPQIIRVFSHKLVAKLE
jgi:hypothetical protein